MHNSHVQEILSRGNVGQLDIVAKEDVPHDQEIDVGSVSGDDDQWTELLFVVVS